MAGERPKRVADIHPDKQRIFDYWVHFIKQLDVRLGGWEWFGTWTFREDTHPESAIKAYMRLQHQINRKGYGVKYWKDKSLGMSSIAAIEYQKRGVLHLHTLDGGTRDYRRMEAMDRWFSMAGIARVFPFRRRGGAEKYVAKYILKGRPWEKVKGGGDLFILGPFSQGKSVSWLHRESVGTLSPVYGSKPEADSVDHAPTGKEGN